MILTIEHDMNSSKRIGVSHTLCQRSFVIIIIIMKFVSDKMSIETIKKKEQNPRTRAHTHNSISVNKTHCSYIYIFTLFFTHTDIHTGPTASSGSLKRSVKVSWKFIRNFSKQSCRHGDRPNKYVAPPYCRTEMYAGRVACCPLVSHGEYADGTDGWTDGRMPDHYITLSARRAPSPPIDSIRAMMIIWRLGGKIIRTVLYYAVNDSCAQWYAHVNSS